MTQLTQMKACKVLTEFSMYYNDGKKKRDGNGNFLQT